MHRRILSALACLLVSCSPSDEPSAEPETATAARPSPPLDMMGDAQLASELSPLIEEVLATTGVPAVGVAIVTAEDGLVAAVVGGVRVAGEETPVTVDDLWHIGSDTKAVTAAMFAREVERGNLSWGESVPTLAPDLAEAIDPAWSEVLIEDVFAHTSGLEGLPQSFFETARRSRLLFRDQRRRLIADRFAEPPGDDRSYAYSNFNYVVAGAVLESGGRDAWEDQARDFMAEIGAEDGTFGFGPPQGDQPQGHDGVTPVAIGQGPAADNPLALGPAGTMHMSLESWAKFVRLFLTGGGDVLSAESVEKLLEPWPTEDSSYAMGWGLAKVPGGRMIFHAGSNTLWFAQAVMLPEEGFAVLIVTNQGGGMGETAVVALTQASLGVMKKRLEEEGR